MMKPMNVPPSLDDISDTRYALQECIDALFQIRLQSIYYSDNHLRERVHELGREADKALRKITTPQ